MKLLTALSILSVFFLVGAEDKPQPCTSPKLFEGQICETWIGKFIDNYVTFSYDAIQKRIYAMRVKITQGVPGDQVVDYLLFKQKIAYQFYPKNKTCVKYPLHFPFRPIAVPKNATFISQTYLGSSASPVDGLLINVWFLKSDIGFDSLSFTAHGCFPLSIMSYNKMAGWSIETFINLTTGIRNPGIFEPPEECLKQEYSREYPLQESDQNPHFSSFL